jgi:hypothetical protein
VKSATRKLLLIVVIAAILYYFGVVRAGQRYIRAIQTLRPHEVEYVLLNGHELARDKMPDFLSLLSEAKLYSPQHPVHQWRVAINIKRKAPLRNLRFPIYGCDGDGVQIPLLSWGEDSGWYYATLRNDNLDFFLRGVGAIHSNQSMKPTAPLRNNRKMIATAPCHSLSLSR